MKAEVHVALILALTAMGWCQQESKGAKALFGEVHFKNQPSSQTAEAQSKPTSPSTPGGSSNRVTEAHSRASGRVSPALIENMGIKYWLELIQPGNAQIVRVNSNRVFHSGERIRLHVETNIDGRVMLLQLGQDGASQVLFPDARINRGDNYIRAGIDTPVPSARAWIKFDNRPGLERLIVFLTPTVRRLPDERPSPLIQADARAAAPQPKPGESSEGALEKPGTATLLAILDRSQGGKGLVVEVDDQSERPASYAVLPAGGIASAKAQDPLAIEIRFRHE
ncbi:MAG TPA: DUF4384 domain-containing protein [Candidatus Dormibacteraeota bacterium]|nr:DUF4384 domain-containing protein [Candidatus Dormibacteraeota bacterium]